MTGNYPPGVSGDEYAIAGPDWDEDAGACPVCGEDSLLREGYGWAVWVICCGCGYQADEEPEW